MGHLLTAKMARADSQFDYLGRNGMSKIRVLGFSP
jgi:hypothetical protein